MEILNQAKIHRLSGEIGAENVPVLLDIFLGELKDYIQHLTDPSSDDLNEYLKEISHALKSSAASFGAEALCAYSIEIDARGKSEQELDVEEVKLRMVSLLSETHQRYQALV